MIKLMAPRLLTALLTVLGVLTFVFIAIRATGDPTAAYLPLNYTKAQEVAVRHQIGADKPVLVQYGLFLQDAARGDLGRSFHWNEGALPLVLGRLPATLKLATAGFVLALVVSLGCGVVAGSRANTLADHLIRFGAISGQAIPSFILALLLIWLFGIHWRLLPVEGTGGWKHIILPALSLSWFPIAAQTRIIRRSLIEVLREDYVRTAHAKGLGRTTVLMRHGLRNALIPIITISGLQWSYFLGGTVIVETIFAWPGLGRLIIEAATARDFAVVQATAIVLSCLFIFVNLVTDLTYLVVDPRLRAG